MDFVPDASSFIVLDELDLLPVLARIRERIVILSNVFDEVDSDRLRRFVGDGTFNLTQLAEPQAEIQPELTLGLGAGEIAVLAYCRTHNLAWAVVDDLLARKVAASIGIPFLGTARFIRHLSDIGQVGRQESERLIRSLPAMGFHIDSKTIEDVLTSPPLKERD